MSESADHTLGTVKIHHAALSRGACLSQRRFPASGCARPAFLRLAVIPGRGRESEIQGMEDVEKGHCLARVGGQAGVQ